MLESIEWEKRCKMESAPSTLIQPVRELVKTALLKVKQGHIDRLGRQKIVLIHPKTKIYFKINNLYPFTTLADGSSAGGLFIKESVFDLRNGFVALKEIQTPSHPDAVNIDNIYLLRGLIPQSVIRTEQALRNSKVVEILDAEFIDDEPQLYLPEPKVN